MENWKEFNIEVVNKQNQNILQDKSPFSYHKVSIDLNQVIAFYENYTPENKEASTLLFKSGDSITILFPYQEFLILRTDNISI